VAKTSLARPAHLKYPLENRSSERITWNYMKNGVNEHAFKKVEREETNAIIDF
jgi:uncharacterized protein (DUF2249 family)